MSGSNTASNGTDQQAVEGGTTENAPMTTDKEEEHGTPSRTSSEEERKPQRDIRGLRWFLVCLAIFSANLLYGLDTTIVADIQDAILETFDDVTKLTWLGIGFGLGSVAVILPM